MPKNPIEFAYGDYEDAAPAVENRRVLNCYPETTPGKNTKTIVRGIEGLQEIDTVSGLFLGSVTRANFRYYVIKNGVGGDLYSVNSAGVSSLAGNMPNLNATSNVRMLFNGKNIIIISDGLSQSNDYYYDPIGVVLDQIATLDPTYSGFARARDVVLKNGYYLFISGINLYHGDNVTLGTGLTFNALSFQPIPSGYSTAIGAVVANSQVYVFTKSGTLIYQAAPTTPFSFQRNISFDIPISATTRTSFTAVGNDIYLLGRTEEAQTVSFYRMSGSSIELLRDQEFKAPLIGDLALVMLSYQLNSHKFVGINNISTVVGADFCYIYDATESALRGYPMWQRRGFVKDTDNQELLNNYPIVEYFSFISTGPQQLWAFGYNKDNDTTYIYSILENSSLNIASFFDTPVDNERIFEYSFPLLRDSSSPIIIKSISIGFNENVSTAELLQTTDGVSFASLGVVDITSVTTNRAEWRRIGRYEVDVSYKIRATVIDTTKPFAIIDGYYIT